MGKGGTEKQRAAAEDSPPPPGLRHAYPVAKPLELGAVHVVLELEALPGTEVIICISEGHMVGLVVRGEVSARALRQIPLRTMERYALGLVRRWALVLGMPEVMDALDEVAPPTIWPPTSEPERAERMQRAMLAAEALRAALTRSQVGTDSKDGYLAALAGAYVMLCARSGTPTKELAEGLSMSSGAVRDHLGEARRRGLLTKPGRGRAGGDLTQKAQAILAREEG